MTAEVNRSPLSAVNYQMRAVGLPGGNTVRDRHSFNKLNDGAHSPVPVSRTSCTAAYNDVKAGRANLPRVKLR